MPLLLAACEKENVAPSQSGDNYIKIGVGMADTRARMEAKDLKNTNTQLTVYGYDGTDIPVFDGLTATPPSQQGGQQGAVKISNWTIKDATGADLEPTWEDGKDYTFFSWTQQDAFGKTASGLFTEGFTYTAAKASTTSTEGDTPAQLAIGAKELSIDEGIMDFCYSNVEARSTKKDATSRPNYSMIELKLEHLFSGFSLSAHNYTGGNITITGATLKNFHNKKSAIITFDPDNGTKAVYTTSTVTGSTTLYTKDLNLLSGSITISAGNSKANIVNGADDATKYFLTWPQTASELACSDLNTASPSGTYLEVKYKIGSGSEQTINLELPKDDDVDGDGVDDGWPAGICQNMELSFSSKSLSLTVRPSKWNQTEPSYEYDGAVNVLAGLSFNTNSKHVIDGHNVYFKPGYPILLDFKIGTPINASWMVEKVGDFDAFEIDNATPGSTGDYGDGIDSKEGIINGEVATISIYPNISDPQKDYVMHLSFTVRGNNGIVTNINSDVQSSNPSDWYNFIILK